MLPSFTYSYYKNSEEIKLILRPKSRLFWGYNLQMFHVWIAGDWDQSYLSLSPFSDQVLFGRGRKEFNWHLYWKAELAISLLKSFFFTILSQPTFAEEDRYHEGTLSSHLGSDLFGHNFRPFSRPDFGEGDGTNHTASVTILLVVTNSFKIPSHRAPQIH